MVIGEFMGERPRLTVDELKKQLRRIEVDWLNEKGRRIIKAIDIVLSSAEKGLSINSLASLIGKLPETTEVLRLVLNMSKDELTNDFLIFLKERKGRPSLPKHLDIVKFCARNPRLCAEFFLKFEGVDRKIREEMSRDYTYRDILIERLKAGRGRAIKGQKRGAFLEDMVEEIIKSLGLPHTRDRNFRGIKGQEAKADFAIPSHENPLVIIEVKAYEATGSKQTDVLGDILKIIRVKPQDVKFYLVTDGIGWLRRESDLVKIVEYYNEGKIDGIFTIATLPKLRNELSKLKNMLSPGILDFIE